MQAVVFMLKKLFKKILFLFKRKRKQQFKAFVFNRCKQLRYITELPDFPHSADYRELKLFVNTHKLPPEIGNRLEELHDEFHLLEKPTSRWR